MAAMAVKHILKAYEPRIAVYGASLHKQVSKLYIIVIDMVVMALKYLPTYSSKPYIIVIDMVALAVKHIHSQGLRACTNRSANS